MFSKALLGSDGQPVWESLGLHSHHIQGAGLACGVRSWLVISQIILVIGFGHIGVGRDLTTSHPTLTTQWFLHAH